MAQCDYGSCGGGAIFLISPVMAETMTVKQQRGICGSCSLYVLLEAGVQYNDGRGNLPYPRRYPVWFAADMSTMWGCSILFLARRRVCVPLQTFRRVYMIF